MTAIGKLAFRHPEALLDEADAEMGSVDAVELFTSPRHQKVREKWCAAMFGLGYSRHLASCSVAVNGSNEHLDADFFVLVGDRTFPFQLVEAMERGRRRGDEFRGFASGKIRSVSYQPELGRTEGPTWIAEAVASKAAKKYASAKDLRLLVYANFSTAGLEIPAVLERAATSCSAFASVWVLTSLHLCTLTPDPALGNVEGWAEVLTIEENNDRAERRNQHQAARHKR